ncbi:MAG: sigma-70 family RNA polymerase sigma factor [Planctomycetaceae bacterium]|nr:sigma-70 family RNA polymerase sigma factor [Planctomycetaceae bacterium]
MLKQCLARSPGAWEDFVDRFIGVIVHVIRHTAHARSVPLTPDDLDDLCSEVFVALLKDDYAILRNFRGESSLSTYLTVIARRIVVKEVTQRRKAEALGHVTAHQAAVDAGQASSGPAVIDQQDEVRALMQHLSPQEARVVQMFYLEGLSYKRIAAELSIPENSIGPILSRARDQLKQHRVAAGA